MPGKQASIVDFPYHKLAVVKRETFKLTANPTSPVAKDKYRQRRVQPEGVHTFQNTRTQSIRVTKTTPIEFKP